MSSEPLQFECIIKEIKSRTSVDMNKSGRIVIEFIPSDSILNKLNELHKPDETVWITVEPNPAGNIGFYNG